MTAQDPGSERTPDEGDGDGTQSVPSLPDEVWQRFLRDSEAAIRTSAPREPSAEERTARHRRETPDDRAPDDGAPGYRAAGYGTTGDGTLGGREPGYRAAGDGTPSDRTPSDGTPGYGMPSDRAPGYGAASGDGALDAVGELWQPEERWSGPAWREMDGTARRRRVARSLGTAAAIAVILGALSALPDGSDTPYDGPGVATTHQSEQAPADVPTAALPSAQPAADRPSPSVRPG